MKKLLKKDVVNRTLESLIAKSFAETVFTLPDGLYYWGVYEGMKRVMQTLFEEKELVEMVRGTKIMENPWADRAVMEQMLLQARIDLANAGMKSKQTLKQFQFGKQYPLGQKFVDMVTDLLRGWSPPGDKK